jgi:preprotein translocase subunit YajC
LLSALVLPGLAYAKKPAGTPGKGPLSLGTAGKPSTAPGLVKKSEGQATVLNQAKKKQGTKKFALRGKIDTLNSGAKSFELVIQGGNWKRIARIADDDAIKKGSKVTIKVVETTIIKLKKDRNKQFSDLRVGDTVNVKGTIVGIGGEMELKARLIIIKPRPE